MTMTKGSQEKYFELLHLKFDADLDELKKAYESRVKAWHPDKFPSNSKRLQKMANDRLREVDLAYNALDKHIRAEAKKTRNNAQRPKIKKIKTVQAKSPPKPESKEARLGKSASRPAEAPENGFHILPNGDKYAGDIVNNKPHGEGIYIFSGGNQ